jgi:hypothetical protein
MTTTHLAIGFLAFSVSFAAADVTTGAYRGTSKTTVTYLHPDTLQPLATEVFTRNETVLVGPPKKTGVQMERNPFSLTILPTTPGTAATLGDVKAASARIFFVGSGYVLLQYWLLQNTATGFSGQLVNNYYADGLAKDRIIANLGGPSGIPAAFRMHDGQIGSALQCTLAATVVDRQLTLKLNGYAFVPGLAIIRFKTRITARR